MQYLPDRMDSAQERSEPVRELVYFEANRRSARSPRKWLDERKRRLMATRVNGG